MSAHRRLAAVVAAMVAVLAAVLAGCAAAPPLAPPPPPWAWEMPQCVVYQPGEYAAVAHRRSASVYDGEMVVEQVEEYEAGWGPRAVEDIRTVVRECARYEAQEFSEQHRVVETGFAGDESLLVETVRLVPPQVRTRYAAVVRYGDQVITLRTSELGAVATQCLVSTDPATCPAGQA
jgi:hypothetical protein